MSNDLLPSSQLPGVTRFQWQQLLGPIVVVVIVSYAASSVSASFAFLTEGTLALLVMVLALQVLIGNSGVLSFGQAAFAMVGGFAYRTSHSTGTDQRKRVGRTVGTTKDGQYGDLPQFGHCGCDRGVPRIYYWTFLDAT